MTNERILMSIQALSDMLRPGFSLPDCWWHDRKVLAIDHSYIIAGKSTFNITINGDWSTETVKIRYDENLNVSIRDLEALALGKPLSETSKGVVWIEIED